MHMNSKTHIQTYIHTHSACTNGTIRNHFMKEMESIWGLILFNLFNELTKFYSEDLKGRYHLKEKDIDGKL